MVVHDEVGVRADNTNNNETMTNTPETYRSEFEKWGKDKFNSFKIDPEDGEYFWIDAQVAWEAWQAALQFIPPNQP